MSTYSAPTTGEVDSDSPQTSTLFSKLAFNPLAIAEADASVPGTLLPTVYLGTFTTTSGSTVTISSLVLTPYKYLLLVCNGVSGTAISTSMGVGSVSSLTQTTTAAANTISGLIFVELATGLGIGMTAETGGNQGVKIGATGYSTATTSVSVTSTGTFDAGSVRMYGCK